MELFIIRHAQSTNNALPDESLRVVDPPLTEIGRRQAELVAAYLARSTDRSTAPCESEPSNGAPIGGNGCYFGIKRIYVSAMQRALETAEPIGRALGLHPEVWVHTHERGGMWLNHGAPAGVVGYPGMTRAEIAARFPDTRLSEDVTENGWYDPALGCESWELGWLRAERVAARLRATNDPDDRIALVTHGEFGSLLLRALFNVPPTARLFFHQENTGITCVRFRANGEASLRYQNRVSHLPGELIT